MSIYIIHIYIYVYIYIIYIYIYIYIYNIYIYIYIYMYNIYRHIRLSNATCLYTVVTIITGAGIAVWGLGNRNKGSGPRKRLLHLQALYWGHPNAWSFTGCSPLPLKNKYDDDDTSDFCIQYSSIFIRKKRKIAWITEQLAPVHLRQRLNTLNHTRSPRSLKVQRASNFIWSNVT